MSDRKESIFALLPYCNREGVKAIAIAESLGLTRDEVSNGLQALKVEGRAQVEGKTKGAKWRRVGKIKAAA